MTTNFSCIQPPRIYIYKIERLYEGNKEFQ
jgi:hypothetical protein